MEKQHIPGLALLVSRRGVPIRAEGFGLANVVFAFSGPVATNFHACGLFRRMPQ
jgi:hypothetical protein